MTPIEKIKAYLSDWENNKTRKNKIDLTSQKLSSKEYAAGLSYICAQAKNPSAQYYGSVFSPYSNEKLRATGIEALVVLQDNLIWLNTKEVEKGQAYQALFKNIIDYLHYTKITGTKKEYEATVLRLQPVVTEVLLKTTDLRMGAETSAESRENINLYQKHNPFPLSALSSMEMAYIYYENLRIRDLEEKPKNDEEVSAEPQNDPMPQKELTEAHMVEIEITQKNLLKDLDEYIGKNREREGEESKEKSSLTIGEKQKKPTLKERKLAVAMKVRGILEENKDKPELIGNKVLALNFCLKLEDGAVLSQHRNRFKEKTENFFGHIVKSLEDLAQHLFGNKVTTVPTKQKKENNGHWRGGFFAPRSDKLEIKMKVELEDLKRQLRPQIVQR